MRAETLLLTIPGEPGNKLLEVHTNEDNEGRLRIVLSCMVTYAAVTADLDERQADMLAKFLNAHV